MLTNAFTCSAKGLTSSLKLSHPTGRTWSQSSSLPQPKTSNLPMDPTGSIIWNCSGNHISKGLFKHLENNVRLWVSGVWSSMTWIRYGLEISGSIFILFYFVYRHAEQWWYPPGEATQPLRQGVALSKCVSAHPQGLPDGCLLHHHEQHTFHPSVRVEGPTHQLQ